MFKFKTMNDKIKELKKQIEAEEKKWLHVSINGVNHIMKWEQ